MIVGGKRRRLAGVGRRAGIWVLTGNRIQHGVTVDSVASLSNIWGKGNGRMHRGHRQRVGAICRLWLGRDGLVGLVVMQLLRDALEEWLVIPCTLDRQIVMVQICM